MKLTYYPETDSFYISLSERPGADVVIISEGFAVDVDAEGTPVGVDIGSDASKVVDLSRLETEGLRFGNIAAGPLGGLGEEAV